MRVCFVSRRYFPAISGMSIYAQNLLRELVRGGHDLTMVSQFYGGGHATVYGGGPPPPVDGVRVIGLEALGEQAGGDFERDVDTMVETIRAEHARAPFDVLHAQYGYPTGWAALLASRALGVPNVVSIQGGDGHWVGSCCATHREAMRRVCLHAGALLIGGTSFVEEVAERLDVPRDRFTLIPGAVDTNRFTPGHASGDVAGPSAHPLPRPGRPPERRARPAGRPGAAARAGCALCRHRQRHRAGRGARPGSRRAARLHRGAGALHRLRGLRRRAAALRAG